VKSVSAASWRRVLNALRYSASGIAAAWRDEPAFKQEVVVAALFIPITLWLQLGLMKTTIIFALMLLVFCIELMNSAVEAIVDLASPGIHPLAKKAKDCASAAVFISSMMLCGVWLAFAGPVILSK